MSDHFVDPNKMVPAAGEPVREVMFLGVSMPTGAETFTAPRIPGWRFVNATRQPLTAGPTGSDTDSKISIQKVCQNR